MTTLNSRAQSTLAVPMPDGQDQPASVKVQKLVGEISQLTLMEVAELSGALKKALNLPDAPVHMMSALPAAASAEVNIIQ
jgi:large subunit ribosomal protein L7/L12